MIEKIFVPLLIVLCIIIGWFLWAGPVGKYIFNKEIHNLHIENINHDTLLIEALQEIIVFDSVEGE